MSNRRFIVYSVAIIILILAGGYFIGNVRAEPDPTVTVIYDWLYFGTSMYSESNYLFNTTNGDLIVVIQTQGGGINYIIRENNVWKIRRQIVPIASYKGGAALGKNSTLHTSFDEDGGELHQMNKTTGYSQGFSWYNDSGADPTNYAGRRFSAIAVRSDDLPAIIYQEGAADTDDVNYIYSTAVGSWSAEYVVYPSSLPLTWFGTIALDSSNNPLMLIVTSGSWMIEAFKNGASAITNQVLFKGYAADMFTDPIRQTIGTYDTFYFANYNTVLNNSVRQFYGSYGNWTVSDTVQIPGDTTNNRRSLVEMVSSDHIAHIFRIGQAENTLYYYRYTPYGSIVYQDEYETPWRTYANASPYLVATLEENSTYYNFHFVVGFSQNMSHIYWPYPKTTEASSIPTASGLSCTPVASIRNSTRTCTNTSNCLKCTGRDWYGFGGNPCIIANTTVQEPQIFPKTFSWCGLCLIETNSSGSGTYCTKTAAFNLNPWVVW